MNTERRSDASCNRQHKGSNKNVKAINFLEEFTDVLPQYIYYVYTTPSHTTQNTHSYVQNAPLLWINTVEDFHETLHDPRPGALDYRWAVMG